MKEIKDKLWNLIRPPGGRDSRRLAALFLFLVGTTYVLGASPFTTAAFDHPVMDTPLPVVGAVMVIAGLGMLFTSDIRATQTGRFWAAFVVGVCCFLMAYFSGRFTSILVWFIIGWAAFGETMVVHEQCGGRDVASHHGPQ